METKKTVIVTGASQGIGAAVVDAFLDRGYNVVVTSRTVSKSDLPPSSSLALVDGDIGRQSTAEKVVETAVSRFGSIDHVVNNAGRSTVLSDSLITARRIPPFLYPPTLKGSFLSPNWQ